MLVTVYEQFEQPELVIPTTIGLNLFDQVDGTCGAVNTSKLLLLLLNNSGRETIGK